MKHIFELWPFLKLKRKKQLILLLISVVLSSLIDVVSIGALFPFLALLTEGSELNPILLSFLEGLFNTKNLNEIISMAAVFFIILVLLAGVFRVFVLWMQTRISFGIGADLSVDVMGNILTQKYEYIKSNKSSDVVATVVKKIDLVVVQGVFPSLVILSSLILLTFFSASILLISPIVFFSLLITLASIYLLLYKIVKGRLRRYSVIVSVKTNDIVEVIQEVIGGIREGFLNNTIGQSISKFKKIDLILRRVQGNFRIISGSPKYMLESLGISAIAFMAYTGNSSGAESSIAYLGTAALALQRMLPNIQTIYASLGSVKVSTSVVLDIISFLKLKKISISHIKPNKTSGLSFKNNIKLNNVIFGYQKNTNSIVEGANIEIFKGDYVGIIGVSGSGKSTILDLISGLLQPTSGALEIDGVRIDSHNSKKWHNHIAYVSQDVFLINGTILENIILSDETGKVVDHKRLKESLVIANIADFVEQLPEGIDTYVGEKGGDLSGGQRQRIGIARAIYKDCDVLILDEITSSLDENNSKNIISLIENIKSKLTIISVSHDLQSLKNCDYILNVENKDISTIKD